MLDLATKAFFLSCPNVSSFKCPEKNMSGLTEPHCTALQPYQNGCGLHNETRKKEKSSSFWSPSESFSYCISCFLSQGRWFFFPVHRFRRLLPAGKCKKDFYGFANARERASESWSLHSLIPTVERQQQQHPRGFHVPCTKERTAFSQD